MRKYLLPIPLTLALLLGSCNGTNVVPIIDWVQQAVATLCSIVPTAETIAEIVAKGNPDLLTAEAIAAAICAAVSPHPKGGPVGGAEVGGVPIRIITIGR